jgi:predicted phosphodiesterase
VRYLVLSDIHGNREALEAVIRDAKGGYDRIVCCGDLSDYGPDSNYVIDWCRDHLYAAIRGNHDRICSGLGTAESFTDMAQVSAKWTMEQLTPVNRNYLCDLPCGPLVVDANLLLVHGSPRDEDEYVTSIPDVAEIFSFLETSPDHGLPVFFGHTHLQGLFVREWGRLRGVSRPLTPTREAKIDIEAGSRYLVNPGSVGQPRDGDPRAAYALLDASAQHITLRRVPYDHLSTERKIVAAGLPLRLGVRLAFGR